MDYSSLPNATYSTIAPSKPGGISASFFDKVLGWIKTNPFKMALIGIATAIILVVIFSAKVQTWLGLRRKNPTLSGHKKRKQIKK